jgi:DNA-directed RNA polymerase delta subunit
MEKPVRVKSVLDGEKTVSVRSFASLLEPFFARLPERSRQILTARYGFGQPKPQTLEEIGKTYGITRERVRQVICTALAGLSKALEKDPGLAPAGARVEAALKKRNGLMPADELVSALVSGSDPNEEGAVLMVLEALKSITCEKANAHHEHLYRLKSVSLERLEAVKRAAEAVLSEAGEVLSGTTLYKRAKDKLDFPIEEADFFHYLNAAKGIKQNVYKKWGLANWSDVRPRGTREKAYLVLKTVGKPLHFREIAALIDEHGLHGRKTKKSHPQTVHNELIKDKRFVLVGRGLYALSDWGYKRGTVKDVIREILTKAGRPLTKDVIVDEVLKVRQVKKSTIIINLNSFFERVERSTYALPK